MKIAQFRDTVIGYTHIRTEDSMKWKSASDVQISDWLDVELKPRPVALAIAQAAEDARAEAKTIVENYEKSLVSVQSCDKSA